LERTGGRVIMEWATAISRRVSFGEAVLEVAEGVARRLGPGPFSLALAFVTPHFADYYPQLHRLVSRYLEPRTFLGCSGGGVIGGGQEVEHSPAVALVAARLPDVRITPFHLEGSLPDLDGPPEDWEREVGVRALEDPQFVLLADPFSARAETLLAGLDYAFPGAPKIGGLASGAASPGYNALFLDEKVFTGGAVGVALRGDVAIDTVVAQGCRPIGELMQVTGCSGNFLYELDGRPAFDSLRELFSSLDERDRRLASSALFVGVLMDEFREEPSAGDFLIRNLVGADPQRGAVAVGENLQEGMRVRFHLRDAKTSAEDLHTMLGSYQKSVPEFSGLSGALLFSCLGRGEGLYGRPNFDTEIFHKHLGDVPVGGFFCNGEIGPVGGTTFLHGYTSSFGLFRPRSPARHPTS
jgi:small ligand-binding sensory domain FIST